MGDEEKFADWFDDWCWDADYMNEIALTQLDLDPLIAPDLGWLSRYLPEKFTSSVGVLERLLAMPERFLELRELLTGDARIKYQEHLETQISEKERFLISMCEKNPAALGKNFGAAAETVRSEFSYLPESLLAEQEFCFLLASQHEPGPE